jgi:hypothetical protein
VLSLAVFLLFFPFFFPCRYGASSFSVQHYCYRKASGGLARHFYTQTSSVDVTIDWDKRQMYVSGAVHGSQPAILRVTLDAASPETNHEVVVSANTSVNAMAFAGGALYYIQVRLPSQPYPLAQMLSITEPIFDILRSTRRTFSLDFEFFLIGSFDPSRIDTTLFANSNSNPCYAPGASVRQVTAYGQRQFQNAVLYTCVPAAESTACATEHATNLSTIPWAFAEEDVYRKVLCVC